MKRTGFKKKTFAEIKAKKKIKKRKKRDDTSVSLIKKKLWQEFSTFIKRRDGNFCITCSRRAEGRGLHAGHFIPSAAGGILLRYHEKNVHSQCRHCNIELGGWGERYAEVMELKYGRSVVEELRALKYQTAKWDLEDYKKKLEYYKALNSSWD